MTKFDKEYLLLAKKILSEGVEVSNRTGINTLKIPNYHFVFDLSDEFPILQSKEVLSKKAILEMMWIWQQQSNDVRDLHKVGVHIWDLWMVDDDGIYRIYEPVTDNYCPFIEVDVMDSYSFSFENGFGNLKPKMVDGKVLKAKSKIPGMNIKEARYYGKEFAYTIGTAYGYITKRFQHTQNLIYTILHNPTDRKMVKSLWQDEFIKTAVLPSCVWALECDVTNNKLNFLIHQRSCDVPLGLPFNVLQYSAFLMMLANVTGLEPGIIEYSIKDAHIYMNQIDGIKEQIDRWDEYERITSLSRNDLCSEYLAICNQYIDMKRIFDANPMNSELKNDFNDVRKKLYMFEFVLEPEKPKLWVNPDVKDFFCYDYSKELKDVKVKNYRHLGKIKFPLAQ